MQPKRGASRICCGRIRPYAATMAMSRLWALKASMSSCDLKFMGVKTGDVLIVCICVHWGRDGLVASAFWAWGLAVDAYDVVLGLA